jgi:lysine-specific permease
MQESSLTNLTNLTNSNNLTNANAAPSQPSSSQAGKKEAAALHRKLNVRMLNMLALGGAIGTGLFLASGNALHLAGPGGTLAAYFITGIMVYFLMTSLGEMAAFMPSSGSFYVYASNFVDPALGYALGWNYWYNWAITVASEISAASLIMSFWFPHASPFIWNALFLIIVVTVNSFTIRGFGTAEYWFSFIKISAVIVFILIGTCMIFGLIGNHRVGFDYWTLGDGPFHGGFMAAFSAFMLAGYSFQGTELIGVAAGESQDPGKSIPKAVSQIFWRILLFFILSVLIISILIPYTSKELAGSTIEMSPFTLIFKQSGISFAASLMNAVILVAILSAGNSGMYASTRMLWYLARKGHVPAILGKLTRHGIPIYALLATTVVSLLAFLSSLYGNGLVYFWLVNASSLSGFIAWLGIAISHYRFRQAYIKQGKSLKDLPYVAKGYPYAPLLAFFLCLIIVFGQNINMLMAKQIDWMGLIISYIGLPVFIGIWLGYKFTKKTKLVDLNTCQFSD